MGLRHHSVLLRDKRSPLLLDSSPCIRVLDDTAASLCARPAHNCKPAGTEKEDQAIRCGQWMLWFEWLSHEQARRVMDDERCGAHQCPSDSYTELTKRLMKSLNFQASGLCLFCEARSPSNGRWAVRCIRRACQQQLNASSSCRQMNCRITSTKECGLFDKFLPLWLYLYLRCLGFAKLHRHA
jgi:hypothetical protein